MGAMLRRRRRGGADHRRHREARGGRVQRILEPRQRGDATIVAPFMQIARGEDAHSHIGRRAERGERDGERFAAGVAGDPRGKRLRATEFLGERRLEAPPVTLESAALQPRRHVGGVRRQRGGKAPAERRAPRRADDPRPLARVGLEE